MKITARFSGAAFCLLALVACTPAEPTAPTSEPAPLTELPSAGPAPESAPTHTTPYDDADSELLLIGPFTDELEECESFGTQTEMNLCAGRNADTSSEQLTQIRLIVADSLDEAARTSLTQSTTAWQAFRDLDCRFASDQFAGGSMESFVYGNCLTYQNLARIEALRGEANPELSYTEADRALNENYQALRTVLRSQRQEALIDVQLAWIEYRDRNCDFEANYSPTFTGTEDQCLAHMSEARARHLQQSVQQNTL
jgi:uncharacterized protein YecT (DUF1311 family)